MMSRTVCFAVLWCNDAATRRKRKSCVYSNWWQCQLCHAPTRWTQRPTALQEVCDFHIRVYISRMCTIINMTLSYSNHCLASPWLNSLPLKLLFLPKSLQSLISSLPFQLLSLSVAVLQDLYANPLSVSLLASMLMVSYIRFFTNLCVFLFLYVVTIIIC